MVEFSHAAPESFMNGAEIPPLKRMRRTEMIRFARSWGVQYPPNPKANQLLPLLEIAIASGQVKLGVQPPHPEFLLSTGDRVRQMKPNDAPQEKAGKFAKWRGPHAKWCVMDGEEVMESGLSKQEAQAACG